MFTGMSLLRKQEKKEQIVTEEMKAREAYLAKMYGTGAGAGRGVCGTIAMNTKHANFSYQEGFGL